MPKKPEAYYRPEDISEALHYLSQPGTVPLGGGTKLLATEEGVADALVDLQALGLNGVGRQGDRLSIGATVTLSDFAEYLQKEFRNAPITPFLRKAIHQAGPNTYRNAATIGGTVASRLADSELLAALLVLEAEVVLLSPQSNKIGLDEFLNAAETPKGLINEISIAWEDGQGSSERVARTPADYPIVSITAWKSADGALRLSATGLGPRPFRLTAAEASLQGERNEQMIGAAAAAAGDANTHPGDFRGDAAYRSEIAAVLTKRVLNQI
ncbi:MAG: FAD binding domain-containing protein [Candidatus Promineifilaceae bacterium]|nr:FAD binding domain-containing protein [Candidatus Promineifilaceae bacterium]